MSNLFEGEFTGKAVKAEFGTDAKSGKAKVRVVMEITDGARSGTQVQYEGNFKPEAIAYTKRDLMALGWAGKTMKTFVADVMSAGKIVPFQVRTASYENPDTGKVRQWNSVGSIGYSAPPLGAADDRMTRDVDSWFADADQPSRPNNGNSGHPNAPGSNNGPAPF